MSRKRFLKTIIVFLFFFVCIKGIYMFSMENKNVSNKVYNFYEAKTFENDNIIGNTIIKREREENILENLKEIKKIKKAVSQIKELQNISKNIEKNIKKFPTLLENLVNDKEYLQNLNRHLITIYQKERQCKKNLEIFEELLKKIQENKINENDNITLKKINNDKYLEYLKNYLNNFNEEEIDNTKYLKHLKNFYEKEIRNSKDIEYPKDYLKNFNEEEKNNSEYFRYFKYFCEEEEKMINTSFLKFLELRKYLKEEYRKQLIDMETKLYAEPYIEMIDEYIELKNNKSYNFMQFKDPSNNLSEIINLVIENTKFELIDEFKDENTQILFNLCDKLFLFPNEINSILNKNFQKIKDFLLEIQKQFASSITIIIIDQYIKDPKLIFLTQNPKKKDIEQYIEILETKIKSNTKCIMEDFSENIELIKNIKLIIDLFIENFNKIKDQIKTSDELYIKEKLLTNIKTIINNIIINPNDKKKITNDIDNYMKQEKKSQMLEELELIEKDLNIFVEKKQLNNNQIKKTIQNIKEKIENNEIYSIENMRQDIIANTKIFIVEEDEKKEIIQNIENVINTENYIQRIIMLNILTLIKKNINIFIKENKIQNKLNDLKNFINAKVQQKDIYMDDEDIIYEISKIKDIILNNSVNSKKVEILNFNKYTNLLINSIQEINEKILSIFYLEYEKNKIKDYFSEDDDQYYFNEDDNQYEINKSLQNIRKKIESIDLIRKDITEKKGCNETKKPKSKKTYDVSQNYLLTIITAMENEKEKKSLAVKFNYILNNITNINEEIKKNEELFKISANSLWKALNEADNEKEKKSPKEILALILTSSISKKKHLEKNKNKDKN